MSTLWSEKRPFSYADCDESLINRSQYIPTRLSLGSAQHINKDVGKCRAHIIVRMVSGDRGQRAAYAMFLLFSLVEN
jgi:hypothetical protein